MISIAVRRVSHQWHHYVTRLFTSSPPKSAHFSQSILLRDLELGTVHGYGRPTHFQQHQHFCSGNRTRSRRLSIGDLNTDLQNTFRNRNISEPRESAEYIIAHTFQEKTLHGLHPSTLLSEEQINEIDRMMKLRLSGMPVQYVLGEWDFRDLTLQMKAPVLIPRPETEMKCVAVDQSAEACDLTRRNAEKLNCLERIQIINAPINQLPLDIQPKFAFIVSNPPYIRNGDMEKLAPEISIFEDHSALNGGIDGLDVIKDILHVAPRILRPGGSLWLEVDSEHPDIIRKLVLNDPLLKNVLQFADSFKDFNNIPRFCHLRYIIDIRIVGGQL